MKNRQEGTGDAHVCMLVCLCMVRGAAWRKYVIADTDALFSDTKELMEGWLDSMDN